MNQLMEHVTNTVVVITRVVPPISILYGINQRIGIELLGETRVNPIAVNNVMGVQVCI